MPPDRRAWIGFVAMCVGLFMAVLDIQIVAAALPRIATSLHAPLDELSWIQTTYLIAEIIAIALSGRLTRALSTHRLFAGAALGFVVASLACALSHDVRALLIWRTLQGFCAGAITPTVFAAGYAMFPKCMQPRAILIAGAVVMLAPSIGPFLGGYIAQKLSWNWLFLINVPTGIAVGAVVAATVRIDRPDRGAWRSIDGLAFIALAASLAALQTVLKLAPEDHWAAARDYALLTVTTGAGWLFVRRSANAAEPLVDLTPLRDLGLRVACAFNFVLGAALYGSLYVLSLFLGFVRFHTPLEIGMIMTVMGVSQLAAAPLTTLLARRLGARALAGLGFGLFAAGALSNAFQTPTTDAGGELVPQILRGAALLACILPITNVALERLPAAALANASGLLSFMRNVGGAVGIGLVDTIINVRPPAIARRLLDDLTHGNAATAAFVGLPASLLAGVNPTQADPSDIAFVKPIIARAAATVAFNEAWLLLGGLLAVSLVLIPLLPQPRHAAARSVAHIRKARS